MPFFRKKPITIEARRTPWPGDYFHELDYSKAMRELAEWCAGSVVTTGGRDDYAGHLNRAVEIKTLEGTMRADVGDWIIRGVQGEFYPCKPDIFDATYERAPQSETGTLDQGGAS